MTKLVDSAFEKISTLPEIEQNIFAQFIIDEIIEEDKWNKSFSKSEDLLSKMADEALTDFNNNQTEILNISNL
ncbi:MAG: hypothetical protein U9N59_02930 [Campylobacterota bacterium]|nr:hypothetical protein [Campylobacterota bacterium]